MIDRCLQPDSEAARAASRWLGMIDWFTGGSWSQLKISGFVVEKVLNVANEGPGFDKLSRVGWTYLAV